MKKDKFISLLTKHKKKIQNLTLLIWKFCKASLPKTKFECSIWDSSFHIKESILKLIYILKQLKLLYVIVQSKVLVQSVFLVVEPLRV